MAVKPLLSDAARATMRKATSIFFTGLLAVLPILVTMSLVMWLIGAAESVLGGMLSILLPGDAYRRGMGLVVAIVLIFAVGIAMQRSEEHTSELQSLMRNWYDVFCLKKKKQIVLTTDTHEEVI